MLALRDHISKYQDPKEAEKNAKEELKINMRHIEEAMKKIRPLSSQELDMYKRIAEQFGKPDLRPPRGGIGRGQPTGGGAIA
jgi:transitional endoplasmic reticulum ATPase